MKKLIVNKKYNEKKLNKFLLDNVPGLTFGVFSNLLRKKDIKINGKRVNKDTIIYDGDEILVYITDEFLENYVGLLTIDELILSGANISKENTYLNYNGWTINRNNDKNYIYNGTNIEEKNPDEEFNVIPSIVLKKDVLHKKGSGTLEDPYIINAN